MKTWWAECFNLIEKQLIRMFWKLDERWQLNDKLCQEKVQSLIQMLPPKLI